MTAKNNDRPIDPMCQQFYVGNVLVDPISNTIVVNGKRKKPPTRSIKLLCILAQNALTAVPKRSLIEHAWEGIEVSNLSITKAIQLLRKEIGDDAANPKIIITERGVGYKLAIEPTLNKQTRKHSFSLYWIALTLLAILAIAFATTTSELNEKPRFERQVEN